MDMSYRAYWMVGFMGLLLAYCLLIVLLGLAAVAELLGM